MSTRVSSNARFVGLEWGQEVSEAFCGTTESYHVLFQKTAMCFDKLNAQSAESFASVCPDDQNFQKFVLACVAFGSQQLPLPGLPRKEDLFSHCRTFQQQEFMQCYNEIGRLVPTTATTYVDVLLGWSRDPRFHQEPSIVQLALILLDSYALEVSSLHNQRKVCAAALAAARKLILNSPTDSEMWPQNIHSITETSLLEIQSEFNAIWPMALSVKTLAGDHQAQQTLSRDLEMMSIDSTASAP